MIACSTVQNSTAQIIICQSIYLSVTCILILAYSAINIATLLWSIPDKRKFMIWNILIQVIVTNTLYETFLMFLLGYGLVQFPKSLWMQSDLDYYLLRTQMRASIDFKSISESQLSVSLVVSDVMKTKAEVSSISCISCSFLFYQKSFLLLTISLCLLLHFCLPLSHSFILFFCLFQFTEIWLHSRLHVGYIINNLVYLPALASSHLSHTFSTMHDDHQPNLSR